MKLDEIKYDIHEVVEKLIGNIYPVGDSLEDENAIENLKVYTELTMIMLNDLMTISSHRFDGRSSVSEIGELAHKFIVGYVKSEIDEYYGDDIEED